MQLTNEQIQAIEHPCDNMQLIACAGSGKTEVIARRVVYLLSPEGGGLSPRNLIAFTYTDKAAAELKDRIVTKCHEKFGEMTGLAEMFVGTIHAYCLELLTNRVDEYRKYDVLDEVKQILFIDRFSAKSGLTKSTDLNGNRLRRFEDTKYYIEALSILREAVLNEKTLDGCTIMKGLDSYKKLLDDERKLDFSSIQEAAVKVLINNRDLRSDISERIRCVIVDEYQDLNPIQEEIIRLHNELGAKICVVGDDDQTIYQWRGSDIQNMLMFADRYSKVSNFPLNDNFRSSQGIVETARIIIEQNPDRLSKAMKATNVQIYEDGDIVAQSFSSPDEEARYIAKTIIALRGITIRDDSVERGISWSDIAVLLRSVNRDGEPIIRAFEEADIPYVVIGMTNLFGTAEAEAARQLFYFIDGRRSIDESILEDYWNKAQLGITSENLKKAIQNVASIKSSLHESDQNTFRKYQIQHVFLKFLEDIEIKEELVPNGRGELVFYNLGKFSQLITDFESIHFHDKSADLYNSFTGFLEHRAQSAYPEGWQDNQYLNPDAVHIMTIHQAKGMQWPVVFIPAMVKNKFPSKKHSGKSVWHLIPKESVKGQKRFEGSEEDERRLFYVAVTRSQKYLFLTYALEADNRLYRKPSEFWNKAISSKFVIRHHPDYSQRKFLPPTPKAKISNVVFSFSDLKYFLDCPYEFKLRILYGFDIPIDRSLGYGKSLHNALAEIHDRAIKGDLVKLEEVPQLVERHLHTPYAYNSLRETLNTAANKVLNNYIVDRGCDLSNIEFSEKQIELSLGEGITVNGRIDLVRIVDKDEIYIVDLKTKERSQAEEVTENQLHVYALGYQQLTGRRPDYLERYDLNERKSNPRPVEDHFLEQVKKKVRYAAEALRNGTMSPKPTKNKCESCDYRGMCSAGCDNNDT